MTATERGLAARFQEAGRPLLMPYATGGFPDREGCLQLLQTYVESGADVVEIGVPFSDPLADGPVIQATSQVALEQGTDPALVLGIAAQVAEMGVGVVLLSYLNTILAPGAEDFFRACWRSGVLGVVIPDLPVEEADLICRAGRKEGVDVVLLAAATSPEERLAKIGRASAGFVYCVSAPGVTGVRKKVDTGLPAFLDRLRMHTDLPLAVGFGVSTPEQAGEVAGVADGVIIGSRLMSIVREEEDFRVGLSQVASFLHDVREEMSVAERD